MNDRETGKGGASPPPAPAPAKKRRAVLPVLEEKFVVKKEAAVKGRVSVATRTYEIEEIAAASLEGQEVEVTRVPVGRALSGELPAVRTEGDTTIVPVFEEVLIVEKRLMLKEELHIRRRATVEQVRVPVKLRMQKAMIRRT